MKRTLTTPEVANYPDDWHFSPVPDAGDFLFFSRITGTRADLSVAADVEAQFRAAFGFLKANLAVAGLTFDDVVEMTTYHVDLRRHLGVLIKVKDEFVRPPYPAWTAIGITELITEGTFVEIRAVATRTRQKELPA
jgi:enamine deaminase RidA (YjgF/YER057c/UK114 family)